MLDDVSYGPGCRNNNGILVVVTSCVSELHHQFPSRHLARVSQCNPTLYVWYSFHGSRRRLQMFPHYSIHLFFTTVDIKIQASSTKSLLQDSRPLSISQDSDAFYTHSGACATDCSALQKSQITDVCHLHSSSFDQPT
jgi:hypothetical protein